MGGKDYVMVGGAQGHVEVSLHKRIFILLFFVSFYTIFYLSSISVNLKESKKIS